MSYVFDSGSIILLTREPGKVLNPHMIEFPYVLMILSGDLPD